MSTCNIIHQLFVTRLFVRTTYDIVFYLTQGDPSLGCRRECETSYECAPQLACIRFKCVDPCPGTCGINAECRVQNHVPECYCLDNYDGNPYLACQLQPGTSTNLKSPLVIAFIISKTQQNNVHAIAI